MFTFEIEHQQGFSRGELLLRTFFGWLYICIPHFFVIYFLAIFLALLRLASFFIILFTGETPEWYYNFNVQLNRWLLRVFARIFNLSDGYPAFGLDATDDKTNFALEKWQIGRGDMVLRTFFGFLYVGIPHAIVLWFRYIASWFLTFLAFFAVLFTGKYPEDWHQFNVGTFRWGTRVSLYLAWLYKDYPPFSGRPDPGPEKFEFENKQ
jgi:hypothetical protein